MKTHTIKAKMSNTGSIHDIADTVDRVIVFAPGCIYAVVMASYYGGKGYTTHRTEESACTKSRQLHKANYSHKIIDVDGNAYTSDGYSLIKNQ